MNIDDSLLVNVLFKLVQQKFSIYQDLLYDDKNQACGPHGLPGETIFVEIDNFLYLFTGIIYFVKAYCTKVVLIIKIYYKISTIRPADKKACLERRFFVDIDNSFLVNIF